MKARSLWLLGLLSGFAYAAPASAATVECSDEFGSCTVSNDNGDFMTCSCGSPEEGSSTAGTGGTEWEHLTEAELEEMCLSNLRFCNYEPEPVEGVTCSTRQATCTISNDPYDYINCDCAGGEGGFGGTGGREWEGLDDEQLMDICLVHANSCLGSDTEGATTGEIPSTTGDWGGDDTVGDTTSGDDTSGDTDGATSSTGGDTDGAPSTTGDDTPECGGVHSDGDDGAGDDDPVPPDQGGEESSGGWSSAGESDEGGAGESGVGGSPVPPYALCTVDPDGGRSGWMLGLLGLAGLLRRRRKA